MKLNGMVVIRIDFGIMQNYQTQRDKEVGDCAAFEMICMEVK